MDANGSFADVASSLSSAAIPAASIAPSSSVFASCPASTPNAAVQTPPASATVVEGKTAFWNVPGETFRFSVVSDKLETVVTLDARASRQKWQCRLDDAAMRQCGPKSVELPRHVVAGFLAEKLAEPQSGPHRLLLQLSEHSHLSLALTLVFGALFAPTFEIVLEQCTLSKEDLLQAQVHDLQDELNDLREEMIELRQFVKANVVDQQAQAMRARSQSDDFKPFVFKVESKPPADAPAPSSGLNAKAAEFVFGQPPRSRGSSSYTEFPPATAPTHLTFSSVYTHTPQPPSTDFFA